MAQVIPLPSLTQLHPTLTILEHSMPSFGLSSVCSFISLTRIERCGFRTSVEIIASEQPSQLTTSNRKMFLEAFYAAGACLLIPDIRAYSEPP